MTWSELRELASTPFFDVQSHTYWHPNFAHEAKRLDQHSYAAFVDNQLEKSRAVLQQQLHRPISLLAWPFGIYNPFLMERASYGGYEAGFSIDCRAVASSDPPMSLPRCLVSTSTSDPAFFSS